MHETGADQWYYLDGSQTRGPVPAAQIAQMIQSGSLNGATQVAQAGAPTWSPASVALAHLLGGARAASPMGAPAAAPTYAIRLACVSGPDHGKAYMIGAAEVSLGRASGLGQGDPYVAENHVVLSWQNNVLHFRTLAGAMVRVAGTDVTQGSLSNGQQFQMGMSVWTVGAAPVELTNLLGSLGARLNQLTSTEKLEGFSVSKMFSELFKKRKPGELEEYFLVGTTKTTPPIEEVQTGWPQPWVFMRVLGFMVVLYGLLYFMFNTWPNAKAIPALMIIGSLALPLTMVILFWELNTPRNVSFQMVLVLVFLGTAGSLIFTSALNKAVNLDWLGAMSAGFIEETAKLLTVVVVVRNTRYKYILNGLLFGAAVGTGFSAFESAGYSFDNGFVGNLLVQLIKNPDNFPTKPFGDFLNHALSVGYQAVIDYVHFRGRMAPFGHMIWTAISAGALWRVKGSQPFRFNMLLDPTFLRAFLVPVGLHMLWNSPILNNPQRDGIWFELKHLTLGLIGWYVVLLLVQQGLRQIKEMQVAHATEAIQQTQQVLTTTGQYRAAR
ncbi:MAG TPA: PrsW family glutamic-type intramembrane protease [Bryobacteraceae bacterium]|jgi:RsiW-degrading membrane proteinase PrsW (M82 family)|nr:PrsW family glutamic-type intramembrane protease [Bryobacteraceae bacterium]